MRTTKTTAYRLITTTLLAALIAVLGACAQQQITQRSESSAVPAPLFELRTYTTHQGKLDELHSRFRDHTQGLFEKHGIKNVAYWTPVDTPNTLIYVIAHASKASAEASWKAFVDDPQWRSVYAKSQANGPLVANIESVFMTATDYSPKN